MKLLRTTDRPEQKYSLAFVGYDNEERSRGDRAHLQLRRRQATTSAAASATSRSACPTSKARASACAASGGKVTREAGPVKGGTTVIAFVEDPDGYKIEFIERRAQRRSAA